MFRFPKFWWKYSEPPRPIPEQHPPDPWPLKSVVVSYSDHDFHTIGDDLAGGTLVLGGTGSGKTSAVARVMRMARLYQGYGINFQTAKQTDVSELLKLCEKAGRLDDVIMIGPGSNNHVNFLDYIVRRYQGGAVEEAVNTLMTCSEVLERGKPGGGGGGENGSFFHNATKAMIGASVSVMRMADEPIAISKIMKMIRTAPRSKAEVRSEECKTDYAMHLIKKADAAPKTAMQKRDFEVDLDYWLDEFPTMPDRTRGSVISTVSGICEPLMRGDAREILCSDTTFEPDWLFERGAIFINTMSTKEYGITGTLVQTIIKHMVQKAIDRRDVMQYPRPVSIDIDEFQTLVTSHDSAFAATCRSQRCGMFLLSQNLPTIYAALGSGDKAKQETDSLLGNCTTKIFCANSCAVTNQWAADLIGKRKQFMLSGNSSFGDEDASSLIFGGGSDRGSAGFNEVMDYDLQPSAFSQELHTGGPQNEWCVDTIIFRNSAKFRANNGKPWTRVTFSQK